MKIYKIIDNTNGNVYIGKTIQELDKRLKHHKYTKQCMSRDIIKNGDYRIELIEETEDDTRERYWILNTECINVIIPGRTHKEWRDLNKDTVMEKNRLRSRAWRKDNPDRARENNRIRCRWEQSMGGRPSRNNMSLLRIDPNILIEG